MKARKRAKRAVRKREKPKNAPSKQCASARNPKTCQESRAHTRKPQKHAEEVTKVLLKGENAQNKREFLWFLSQGRALRQKCERCEQTKSRYARLCLAYRGVVLPPDKVPLLPSRKKAEAEPCVKTLKSVWGGVNVYRVFARGASCRLFCRSRLSVRVKSSCK